MVHEQLDTKLDKYISNNIKIRKEKQWDNKVEHIILKRKK